MSVYSDGVATLGNTGVDVKMPANIRDEIVTVAAGVKSLDVAIKAAPVGKLPADFVAGWTSFRDEWDTFANSHRLWIQNMWYASYEKTIEYRKRLADWRTKFEGIVGQKLNVPALDATPQGLSPDGSGFPWKTLMWGGIIIGGLWGAAKVFGEGARLKREVFGSATVQDAAGHVRRLLPPRHHVSNPPVWARDPELWESAKLAVSPHADRMDNPHAVIVHVYKQMGGRVGA